MSSGDLNLFFDSDGYIVTGEQLSNMCRAVLNNEIDLLDASFLANAILLSGFDFDSCNTEEIAYLLASPEVEGIALADIREMVPNDSFRET